MSDTEALAWLDRLLDVDIAERELHLRRLAIDDPALHVRLLRLLNAALAPDSSRILAVPVLESFRAARELSTPTLAAGQCIAGYRLNRELGRGGMSVVWLAERVDGVVKRQVALKLPLFALSSRSDAERFAREKDVLASLTHPHIARLYDAGIASSGQPFIVLEFVDGVPITEYCDRHCSSTDERLRLFLQVLAAVDFAHKHLVVHRDLKPSNILVDQQGQVKLLDFGIAKLLPDAQGVDAAQLTQHGDAALTPLYASPEQLSAQPVSVFADIYVLGVVLHQLLTGALPYAGATGDQRDLVKIIDAVLHGVATRPSHAPMDDEAARLRGLPDCRRLRAALAGDLDTIVRKAMAHTPAQRYGSAEHFADDVRRFLARKPISARRPTALYSTRLFLRRHRNASFAAAIGIVLSLIAGGFAIDQSREARLHEARSAAVRDFMFDLVNDAEPNESQPDAPITFLEMLDGAVVRARVDFGKQPQLEGELLNELGRMYRRLGNATRSAAVLSEALSLLAASAPSDDPALNKARANVAASLVDENELERARALATAVIADCTRKSVDCAKARAYAFSALATIQQRDGQAALAIASMRDGVQETIRAFGEKDEETALAMLSLAIAQRNAGQLRDAMSMATRATLLSVDLTLRKADRTVLSRTMAMLDLDMGEYESARKRLIESLAQPLERDERALQLRFLSSVLLEEGEPRLALNCADSALSLAVAHDIESLYARQNRARAFALLGQSDQAMEEIDAVIAGLAEAGLSADARPYLRAQRFRAEIRLRAAHPAEALRDLVMLEGRLRGMSDSPAIELGQVLDLMGSALRELHRPADAAAAHEKARMYLTKELSADHPFVKRNAFYADVVALDGEEIRRGALALTKNMTPDSDWRRMIEAQLRPDTCASTGSQTCLLVL